MGKKKSEYFITFNHKSGVINLKFSFTGENEGYETAITVKGRDEVVDSIKEATLSNDVKEKTSSGTILTSSSNPSVVVAWLEEGKWLNEKEAEEATKIVHALQGKPATPVV